MKHKPSKVSPKASPRPPARARVVPDERTIPTHREIAVEAEVLWRQRGCPSGDDEQIWLEAERQLHHVPRVARDKWERFARSNPLSRMDLHSDDVMAELEELFPVPSSPVSTAL